MISAILKRLTLCVFITVNTSLSASVINTPDQLQQKINSTLKSMPDSYQPRTEHICKNKQPCYTNRLILENSPYLLQHAHNPVNWYPWGQEALEKAKRENKPIFLSIGYAACHWCHVMERESFDNLDIARILNENFIAIKVDREQRPDIDEFYGNAVVYFQGQMGWPMSVFLTPEGKPFNGGGYYPRQAFSTLLLKMSDYWKNQQDDAIQTSQSVIDTLNTANKAQNRASEIDSQLRKKAIKRLFSIVDNYNGGFGEGSKFPRESWLFLLLDDSYGKAADNDSLITLGSALTHMARGGIYDQIAGGFHRYTTDPYWRRPHFEKMLYNQALLIRLYLETASIQPDRLYTRVARQTADFLLDVMRSPQGGFYASLDADTENEEGRFYLWSLDEWKASLKPADNQLFAELFDVDEYGETDNGGNILYLFYSLDEFAKEKNIAREELQRRLDSVRKQLKKQRELRRQPTIDKKIIMGWNGLTITALAEASLHLNEKKYLSAATAAANFIWNNMQSDDSFYRSQYQGKNSHMAQLNDYAFYLQALITLYDIQQKEIWLERAEKLSRIMLTLLWDNENGGFFNAPLNTEAALPVRPKTAFDKSLPSGNAIAAQMFIRLAQRTDNDEYRQKANRLFSSFSASIAEVPSAFSSLLIAAHEAKEGEKSLPVYGARGHLRIDAWIESIDANNYKLNVDIGFDDKWHINSHQPLDKQLIPSQIKLADNSQWLLKNVQYPRHEMIKLGFSRQTLALYQHHIQITAQLKKLSTPLNPHIVLQLQACNDRICLPPEKLHLYPRFLSKTNHQEKQ